MGSRPMMDKHIGYEQKSKAAILLPGAGNQLQIMAAHLTNISGGAADLALLIRLSNSGYNFSLDQVGVVTDVTSALQAATPQNVFTTTNNDGFLVQATDIFGLVGLHVTQAQGAGVPVYAYKYWNGAAFVALPFIIDTPDFSSIGDKVLFFVAPRDWVPGGGLGVAGKYTILAQATTAPVQAVIANDVWVGRTMHYQPQIPNNGILSMIYEDTYPKFLDGDEGLLPYFGVAHAHNCVTVKWFPRS